MDAIVVPPGVVVPAPVTVNVAELLIAPENPCIVAVMVVVPAESPVATPVELTDATACTLDVQVTVFVTLLLLVGWVPCPVTPVAVNCAV
jgi:hypothetical protein